MALKSLIKFDSVKTNKKVFDLDYSSMDPAAVQRKDVAEASIIKMLADASNEAKSIVNAAENRAEALISVSQGRADKIVSDAKRQIEIERKKFEETLLEQRQLEEKAIEEAKAKNIIELELKEKEVVIMHDKVIKEVKEEIWETVREEAKIKADEEFSRVIEQAHAILNEAVIQRKSIMLDIEKDITQLVLLIAHKVVKVISEKDENVVLQNVISAMEKVKGRERYLIRVNYKNFNFLSEYISKIKAQLEVEGKIEVVEDSKVDVGGCVIETEFGDVDARIVTQLSEIEKRIRDSELIKNVSFKY